MFRSSPAWVASAALALVSVLPVPAALAQAAAPKKAASLQTMDALALAAAVSTCELTIESKIPAQTTVAAMSRSIVYTVDQLSNGEIEGAGKVGEEQIFNVTLIRIVGYVKRGCFSKLPKTDQAFIDDVISKASAAIKSGQPPKK